MDETGVAILPGKAFGMEPDELITRLAYVDIDGAVALNAAKFMKSPEEISDEFLQKYCGNVLQTITLIIDWVKD